jgi:hypothetical protein
MKVLTRLALGIAIVTTLIILLAAIFSIFTEQCAQLVPLGSAPSCDYSDRFITHIIGIGWVAGIFFPVPLAVILSPVIIGAIKDRRNRPLILRNTSANPSLSKRTIRFTFMFLALGVLIASIYYFFSYPFEFNLNDYGEMLGIVAIFWIPATAALSAVYLLWIYFRAPNKN